MSVNSSSCDTLIPAKRSAPSDYEPLRISRSRTADDPYSRNLLLESHSPPPVPTSTRRRVNPESLAVRLGPELVKELESYVQPGVVEMPSFAIRQQIQRRHKVDRRHIYDWFHSKGLRVTKEDKRATVEQKTDAMRLQRRIRRSIAPAVPIIRPCPSLSDAATDSAPSSPALLTPPVAPSEFCRPAPTKTTASLMTSLDHHGIIRPRHKALHAVEPAALSGHVRDRDSLSVGRVLHHMNSTLNLPPRPPSGYTRKFRDPHIDSVFYLDETTMFDQRRRENCYDTLSRVLGPADGIQECVGTYKAHMARQLEIYYEDFIPKNPAPYSEDRCEAPGSEPSPLMDTQRETRSGEASSQREAVALWNTLSNVLAAFSPVSPVSPEQPDLAESSFTLCSLDWLDLDDILVTPALSELERQRTVTFATDEVSSQPSSAPFSPTDVPYFNSNSSSLAGALGEAASTLVQPGNEGRRKTKDWVRPRMGRARAYSAGGGM